MTTPLRLVPSSDGASDEELLRQLAAGCEEALAPLHERYASLVFNIAAQSLDRAAAEEIVQDVFLAVWQKAGTYDPARGPVRPWLLQIAHFRVLNELRRRERRPAVVPDPEGTHLNAVADGAPEPDEAVVHADRSAAVRDAVDALPLPQRQALRLAFFDDLSHEQVATRLGLPLGTAKTRIRTGMQRLRVSLVAVLVAVLAATGGLVALGVRYDRQQAELDRNESALRMVTTSNVTAVRLVAQPGAPATSHGYYRSRPDSDLAVLTVSHMAPAPSGETYQAWASYGGTWRSLGLITVGSDGTALVILDQHDAGAPDAVQVTLEPAGGSSAPSGPPIIAWTGP